MNALGRLIHPRSVAIVGASADPEKLTGRPVAYLQKHGFAGDIYPINPRYGTIAGLTCYPDVKSLPRPPDVGLVLLGAEMAADAVRQLAAVGTAAAVVLASGFAEAGADGHARQAALRAAAGAMRLLGPNTIGLVNLTDRITLSASGALEIAEFQAGNIAVISQSGGILGSLLSRAAGRGIGLSKLIATGNEADIEAADCIEALIDDPATSVIALYLEGLRNPGRFREVAIRAAAAGKPLVVFKVGRSESGARSAVSHTGALAGADRIYDALFRQVGAVRAATFADLLDIPMALAARRTLAGRRIAIVTSTGGAATLVADACGLAGLDLPPPDPATAERLVGLNIRDAVLDRNPIDVTLAGVRPELFRQVIDALSASPSYDAVIMIVGSSGLARPDIVAGPVIEALPRLTKPLLVYVSPDAPNIIKHLNRHGVPAFAAPESCAAALAALLPAHASPSPAAPPATSPRVTPGDLPPGPGPLNEAESKRLFERFGIPSVTELSAPTPEAASDAARKLSGPVVVKILSRAVAHKSEIGGVAVGVAAEHVAERCRTMSAAAAAAKAPIEGFLVQEQIRDGIEMILGFHRDPQLGPAILLGLGGIATELFDDTAIRLPPLGPRDAQAMIAELKSAALLHGFRGRPKADVAALADAILAFQAMVLALEDRLGEAEINPLFVLPQGRGVRAADGVVVLR
ncbi:MAG TPA: acetate--CoA ligase family protein [Alphaproteobacteria bacterium]|nr:acetate--CoA ligase family protein [Alphaproteobacteria bacterium]